MPQNAILNQHRRGSRATGCQPEGKVDNWGDTAPVFFEYDKDNFVLSYGHRFGVSKAGTKSAPFFGKKEALFLQKRASLRT